MIPCNGYANGVTHSVFFPTDLIMTQISFTSGEILDIISALDNIAEDLEDAENYHLAAYYANIMTQFETVLDKLKDFPGENRVANLVLAAN